MCLLCTDIILYEVGFAGQGTRDKCIQNKFLSVGIRSKTFVLRGVGRLRLFESDRAEMINFSEVYLLLACPVSWLGRSIAGLGGVF